MATMWLAYYLPIIVHMCYAYVRNLTCPVRLRSILGYLCLPIQYLNHPCLAFARCCRRRVCGLGLKYFISGVTKFTWPFAKHFLNTRFTFVKAITSNSWQSVYFLEVSFSSPCSGKFIWIRMTHVFSVTASSFSYKLRLVRHLQFRSQSQKRVECACVVHFGARPYRTLPRDIFIPIA